MSDQPLADARNQPRTRLPAMYTLLRVRQPGSSRYQWTGHIYDISESGMRFELDKPIEPGTQVEVRAMLPGARHTTVDAAGRIVRLHAEDEPGPARMCLKFDTFTRPIDQHKLEQYLANAPRIAA